jgi:hypothetical protein
MKTKRAQVAIETIAYISFLIIVFSFLAVYFLFNFSTEIKNRQYLVSKATSELILSHFSFVVQNGPGTSINFTVPQKISIGFSDSDYYILINKRSGTAYLVLTSKDISEPYFSFQTGFRNFSCKYSSIHIGPTSCISTPDILNISPSKGWIHLNYTAKTIEVE